MKQWKELNDIEKMETIEKALNSARKFIEGKAQNITVVEEMLQYGSDTREEIKVEMFIQCERRAEKYPDKDSFIIAFGSAMIAYYKLLDEKLGKRTYKKVACGKYATDGRRENKAIDIYNTEKIQYAYNENEYKVTETMIDIFNACKSERDRQVIELKIYGLSNVEIAKIFELSDRQVRRDIDRIYKEFKK